LFIVIIEFVIVGIPTLMINLKERKEKAEKE
jgi:hypothetical protein